MPGLRTQVTLERRRQLRELYRKIDAFIDEAVNTDIIHIPYKLLPGFQRWMKEHVAYHYELSGWYVDYQHTSPSDPLHGRDGIILRTPARHWLNTCGVLVLVGLMIGFVWVLFHAF